MPWPTNENARQVQLFGFLEVHLVDGPARGTRPDGVEQHVLAGGEIGPDALGLRRRAADRRRTAHARMIALDDRKDFHPADITGIKHAPGRPDIGKHAALAGRHDHQLEIVRALFINPAGERGGDIHLGRAGGDRPIGLRDGAVGDAGEFSQDVDLFPRLDLAQPRQQSLRRRELRARQQPAEVGEIRSRQVIQLDADAGACEAVARQQVGQHRHGVERKFAPHRNLDIVLAFGARTDFGPDRARLHIDDGKRRRAVGRDHDKSMPPAHQRLGRR